LVFSASFNIIILIVMWLFFSMQYPEAYARASKLFDVSVLEIRNNMITTKNISNDVANTKERLFI